MTVTSTDLICLSHLRWGFVFQRPQHLMSRFAKTRRVFFFEEPLFEEGAAHLRCETCTKTGVRICTPVLPPHLSAAEITFTQQELLHSLMREETISRYALWYYTPMALEFTSELRPEVTVYDCMDELAGFAGAPAPLRENERRLFEAADVVFTGGASLYAAKRTQHPAVYLFPSSVDVPHFARARTIREEPADQAQLSQPRIGYAGVIDERMDLDLIRYLAEQKPEWQIILLGPVVKIDPASLPQASNIHYLGMKPYSDLPSYFAGWQVGLLPFALNDATRFISPTKTPEYLAAGLRVASTAITDVVRPYGEQGLAEIATNRDDFLKAVENLVSQSHPTDEFRSKVDQFLSRLSWDDTWRRMDEIMNGLGEQGGAIPAYGTTGTTEGAAHV